MPSTIRAGTPYAFARSATSGTSATRLYRVEAPYKLFSQTSTTGSRSTAAKLIPS